jgi:branched-chain amino acid transport system substrate-binding protein
MFRFRWALAGCVVAALTLSACGSTSSSSSTTPAATSPGSASTSASASAGAAIKVGFICSCSGPQASLIAGSEKVARAWADNVNASGGINGHPVRLFTYDDGQNPATALQDAKALVDQDHVIAIVGEISEIDGTWVPWVVAHGIPVVGGASGDPVQGTNPGVFPSGSTLLAITVGTIAEAKGKKNFGVMYCAETPVCAQFVPLATGVGKLFGLKVTATSISATAPSYAAPCLKFKSAGVDALFVGDNGTIVQRVVAACSQQGYAPLEATTEAATSSAMLTDSQLAGTLAAGSNANPFDSSLPAVKEFQAAVQKYYPGLLGSAGYTQDDFYAWTGGKLFEAAAKAANIGPTSTPAELKAGLYALKNETLGGIAPPLTFTKGKPYFSPCWFSTKIENGTLISLNGNRPVCLPAVQTAALVTALHLG